MVRIKPAPEPLFPKGRITLRQTTREVIHEVAVEDEQRFGRDHGPQYSVEHPQSPTRQDDRNTFGRNDRQNSDTFSSRHYDGPSEYMTREPSFAKPFQDRSRQYKGQNSFNPSHSRIDRTGNEYMTGEREYGSRSKEKEQYSGRYVDPSFSRNFDGSSEYMTERSYARPMDTRSRQQDDRENFDPTLSRINGSRNEYMADDRLYSSRTKESLRNLDLQEVREPLQRRQINEYHTDNAEAPIENLRDSSFLLAREILERDSSIPLSNSKRLDAYEQRVINDGESSHHLGESRRMLYRTQGNPELRDGNRDVAWANTRAPASRRSGGAPRFGAKSLARGSMKRRHRPGALALKEIRRLQKSTHNLIPRLPLQRVFREVVRELYPNGEYRFTQECCEALQEAAEIHLVEAFSNANTCAVHAKRVTVKPDDIHLVRMLQGW